jgi:hypothetical protein
MRKCWINYEGIDGKSSLFINVSFLLLIVSRSLITSKSRANTNKKNPKKYIFLTMAVILTGVIMKTVKLEVLWQKLVLYSFSGGKNWRWKSRKKFLLTTFLLSFTLQLSYRVIFIFSLFFFWSRHTICFYFFEAPWDVALGCCFEATLFMRMCRKRKWWFCFS